MELTILMPCLNEAETLATCISKAKKFLESEKIHGEVLIADNGSVDGSKNIAAQLDARVIDVSTRGYGAALQAGIKQAHGQYIIMGDADDSYDFTSLMPFVTKLRQGADIVMGNRFAGGVMPGAMPLLNKYLGNPVLSFLGRIFFRCPIGDFHCGLRGFSKAAIQQLDLQCPGMEFASEMVIKSAMKNLRLEEVPTILSPDGRSRPPHLRRWRDGWRHLRLLLLFSPRWLFLYPGILMMLLGFLFTIILSFRSIHLGSVGLGIHTLLFAGVSLITGVQAISFAIFGRIIAGLRLGVPLGDSISKFLRIFTLERGLAAGLLLSLIGVSGGCFTFYHWMNADFGDLAPVSTMRITIPSVMSFILGMQIIFASFYMRMLAVNDRDS